MTQRLFMCTPTRLLTWLDCPRKYRFTYVERPAPPKGPPWAHTSLGASVHNTLKSWWNLPTDERTAPAAGDLLDAGWLSDGYRDAEQSEEWRLRAREMVQAYVSTLDPHREPRGVERTVATATETLAFSGRVDRIDERTDSDGDRAFVVVDYKMSREVPTVDDVRGSLALALYAVATQRTLRGRCIRVELHHVPSGTVVGWDHTPESLDRHLRRAESLAAEARAAEAAVADSSDELAADQVDALFPARPSQLCGWCDFAAHCPTGRAVAESRDPWASLVSR